MKSAIPCFAATLLALVCCSPPERNNSALIKEELESRKVKRVLPSQIMDRAMEMGAAAAGEMERSIVQNMRKKMETEGALQVVNYCKETAYQLIDSMARTYQVSIRQISSRNTSAMTPEELAVMEAYRYAMEQGEPLRSEVFFSENGSHVIYVAPVGKWAHLCLQCSDQHDGADTTAAEQQVRELNPADTARAFYPHTQGSIWKVTFEKKLIVRGL